MGRSLALAAVIAALLAACSSAVELHGTYSGALYASGSYVGSMDLAVTTTSHTLSGAGCFIAPDLSTACNPVLGSVGGPSVRFATGTLSFAGTVDGDTITTTFERTDGAWTGTATFRRYALTIASPNR